MANRKKKTPFIGVILSLAALLVSTGCGSSQTKDNSRYEEFVCPRDRNLEPTIAERMRPKALPSIWATLENPEYKKCWNSAIMAAGYIGGKQVYPGLRAFIEKRGAGLAMSEDLYVAEQVFSALGTLVRLNKKGSGVEGALDYLLECTNPENLEKMTATWPISAVSRRDMIRSMAHAAVAALAETGTETANQTLHQSDSKNKYSDHIAIQQKALDRLRALAFDSSERRSFEYKSYEADAAYALIEGMFTIHSLTPGRVQLAMDELMAKVGVNCANLRVQDDDQSEVPQDIKELLNQNKDEVKNTLKKVTDAKNEGKELDEFGFEQGHLLEKANAARDYWENRANLQIQFRIYDQMVRVRDAASEAYLAEEEWRNAQQTLKAYLRNVSYWNEVADARLTGFDGQLESLKQLLDAPDDLRAVDEIMEEIFPEGPLTVINMAELDQVNFVLQQVEVIRDQYGASLSRLKLNSHLLAVEEAHKKLKQALESNIEGAGYDKVIRLRARLQNELHIYFANVITFFPGEQNVQMRTTLMRGLLEQDEQITNALRRRAQIRDVNPKTGTEIIPENDEENQETTR